MTWIVVQVLRLAATSLFEEDERGQYTMHFYKPCPLCALLDTADELERS